MTEQQHPITPSDELVKQWLGQYYGCVVGGELTTNERYLADQASQWGWQQRDATVPQERQEAADQELEACCEWLSTATYADTLGSYTTKHVAVDLRAARRPKPKTQAKEALEALDLIDQLPTPEHHSVIRRALERLQELEGQVNG